MLFQILTDNGKELKRRKALLPNLISSEFGERGPLYPARAYPPQSNYTSHLGPTPCLFWKVLSLGSPFCICWSPVMAGVSSTIEDVSMNFPSTDASRSQFASSKWEVFYAWHPSSVLFDLGEWGRESTHTILCLALPETCFSPWPSFPELMA